MSDTNPISVFSSEFLHFTASREPAPLSTHEASLASPLKVEPYGNDFAVIREIDGEPEAVTRFQDIALLIAAALPGTGRGSRYWCQLDQTAGQKTHALQTTGQSGPTTVGHLKNPNEDLPLSLSLLDHVVRSPAALAFLIEAASTEALSQASAILARRLQVAPGDPLAGVGK